MATISKNLTVAAKNVYTLSINNIPTGSSVTPVNDIQTWLHCADIWDKTYTTINQVLADASTLQALIASNNAADYMARSTSWASSVCANSNAMTYIGANNYCANKLLANSTWCSAICNSAYFESVLNVKVPTMTSNTTPSGVVSASQENTSSAYKAYKAFDNDDTTGWYANDEVSTNQWIGYDFGTPVLIVKVKVRPQYYISKARLKNIDIRYSSDDITFSGTNSFLVPNANQDNEYILTDKESRRYWRMFVADDYGSTIGCATLQFYGRQDI